MGVRTIVGTVDGTRSGAAMYDSTTGWMLGDIWEADDASEQIEAFQKWLAEYGPVKAIESGQLELDSDDLHDPMREGTDARDWPQHGLVKLANHWRHVHVDEGGLNLPPRLHTNHHRSQS